MILRFHDEGGESETGFMNSLLFLQKNQAGSCLCV